jgi:hypothetical protein
MVHCEHRAVLFSIVDLYWVEGDEAVLPQRAVERFARRSGGNGTSNLDKQVSRTMRRKMGDPRTRRD